MPLPYAPPQLLSLPVSPLFDRDKPGVTKSQCGFFDFVTRGCPHLPMPYVLALSNLHLPAQRQRAPPASGTLCCLQWCSRG